MSNNQGPGSATGTSSPRKSIEMAKVEHINDEGAVPGETVEVTNRADDLERGLGNCQLQLVGIGASIGTGIFISIGGGALYNAGPGNLLLASVVQNFFVAMVNNSTAEMATHMPVAGGFIRLAGKWVDDALGFAAGWNFFIHQVIVVPFEIVALSLVLSFWSDNISTIAICLGCPALFTVINIIAVGIYGEAFGFHNFNIDGAFKEYIGTGPAGQFQCFLNALIVAAFTCVGPEYITMIAAEAEHPRTYIKQSFKNVYWRQIVFFCGGALAVGILVPHNDPTLASFFSPDASKGSGTAGASPYVIAMGNMGIKILPHIVSALLAMTLFSCGNTYSYCATRILYGMAIEGRAPAFLKKCTKRGIPIYCFIVVQLISLLSLLQLGSSSAEVLNWLITMATTATVIHYVVISLTYVRFYGVCKAQGFDRNTLPYKGWFQPYCGYIGLFWMTLVVLIFGYTAFDPWNTTTFFTTYTLVGLFPILYVGWKVVKKTKIIGLNEVDLVWEGPAITAYEESLQDAPIGFWRGIWRTVKSFPKSKAEKMEASA